MSNYDPIPNWLPSLSRRYARLNNWLWACHDYSTNGGPRPVGRPPSKALKGWAYDDLYALVRAADLTVPAEYAGTLHAMNYVLTALGKRPRPVAPNVPLREVVNA
jgi:hypothetical protein